MEKYIYSVATGKVDPTRPDSVKAMAYITSLDGFYGLNFAEKGGALWFFETKQQAIRARNKIEAEGILCGTNICKFEAKENETVFVEVC